MTIDGKWSEDPGPNYTSGPYYPSLVVIKLLDDKGGKLTYSCKTKNHQELFTLIFNVNVNILSHNLSGKERAVIFKIIPAHLDQRLHRISISPIQDGQTCDREYMYNHTGLTSHYIQWDIISNIGIFSVKWNISENDEASQCIHFSFLTSLTDQYRKLPQIKTIKTAETSVTTLPSTGPTPRGTAGYNSPGLLVLVLPLFFITLWI